MLSELFILDKKISTLTSDGSREFFDIGLPMTNPVSPSGTIFVSLERSFLTRNEETFLWASIPDNGGIRTGFLPYIPQNFYKSVRLNFPQFSKILDQIDSLPSDSRRDVLTKKPSRQFCEKIQDFLDERVIDGMLAQPMEAARRIEFCLDGDFKISDTDVKTIHVPNTYKHIFSARNANFSQDKLVYYNPKKSVLNFG